MLVDFQSSKVKLNLLLLIDLKMEVKNQRGGLIDDTNKICSVVAAARIVTGVERVKGGDLSVFGSYLKPFLYWCCPGLVILFYMALGNLELEDLF